MYFRLALAIGCTVRELLDRIDSRELAEWFAFWELEMWGDQRADLRMAVSTCNLMNMEGRIVPKGKEIRAKDLLYLREEREQTPEQMMKVLRAGTLAAGGEVK